MEKRLEKNEKDIDFLKGMQIATQNLLTSVNKNLSKISDTLTEMQKENVASNIYRKAVENDIKELKLDRDNDRTNIYGLIRKHKKAISDIETKVSVHKNNLEPLIESKKKSVDRWKSLPFGIAITLIATLLFWIITQNF